MNATQATESKPLVLLFNKVAHHTRAARVHVDSCSLVAAARASRGRVAVIEGDLTDEIADLNEREFPVKFCKCTK